MKNIERLVITNSLAFRAGGALVVAALVFLSAKELTASVSPAPSTTASALVGLLAAFGWEWLAERLVNMLKKGKRLEEELQRAGQEKQALNANLDALLHANKKLSTIYDEKELIDSILTEAQSMAGATGVSFVPIDEFGQPYPAFIHSDDPDLDLQSWSEYLSTPGVRDRCRACQNRLASPGYSCPLLKRSTKDPVKVVCFPLERDERILGMLNLYLPLAAEINQDAHVYLQSILDGLALALDALHLRKQEMTTLRQLQLLRSSVLDLESSLANLLDQVKSAFDADFGAVLVQTRGETKPRLMIRQDFGSQVSDAELDLLINEMLTDGRAYIPDLNPDGMGLAHPALSIMVSPLKMVDRPVVGMMLIGCERPQAFNLSQLTVLQMVASQAALLVEHNHLIIDLEYKVVVKERTRLAREIHDGIAQLLAFLKLQTGQMQGLLSQGQYSRLDQSLKANYQALTEAYLSTRQTIDDLRLTPQEGMRRWLEQIAADFQNTTGLPVSLTMDTDIRSLTNEIQLQLIRIIQEALSNIRKHAKANRVVISVREWKGEFILEIQDDGEGFSPEDVPGVSQYGLRGMKERTELIGADFQIISQPHSGTTIRIAMPFPMEETQA